MPCKTIDVEDHLNRTVAGVDLEQSGHTYWEQNECLILNRFIPKTIVNPCLTEVELLRKNIFRNYVPGHKQGGSVSYYAIWNEFHESSAIVSLYRSPALRRFLSTIVKEELLLCPEHDPHSCALYYYTKPGDHIGFHYDTSYYKGKRYTVLMGLIERSEQCHLVANLPTPGMQEEVHEQPIPLDPGSLVIFNGDKLWHAVTPLGSREERIVLTLQYVTDPEMGPFQRAFSNLKDAFAYFGPAAIIHRSDRSAPY
ncbi:MAG: 2OG-Fe(II) oxygenase [Nitrospira sp.]